jgi:CTP synthase
MREEGLDSEVVQLLSLGGRVNSAADARAAIEWQRFTDRIGRENHAVTVGITGKYTSLRDSYASIIKALEHAGVANDAKVRPKWIDTTEIDADNVTDALADVSAIIVPGGFGVRGTAGKIECVRYAREQGVPYLGICLGFQMAVIEYARNVLGYEDAHSTEMTNITQHPVIDLMEEQKGVTEKGGTMRLGGYACALKKDSKVHEAYGADLVRERHRHRYEFNNDYMDAFEEGGMVPTGINPESGLVEIMEQTGHPWFVGTQFHPEYRSTVLNPHPLFIAFIKAAMENLTSSC